jgi:transcriptional regulator with XRE-family HTH domain
MPPGPPRLECSVGWRHTGAAAASYRRAPHSADDNCVPPRHRPFPRQAAPSVMSETSATFPKSSLSILIACCNVSPSQCRAARALLSWSQEDLEERSDVAKKTIADFERGARYPNDRTSEALQKTLETNGVIFIPANGGGPGVRLKRAMPQFFRRSDVPDRNWIAFAFDYKDERHTAFVTYEALATLASAHPLKVSTTISSGSSCLAPNWWIARDWTRKED